MRRKKIALIDLDLQFGDVSLMLGLKPEVTIYDLIVSGGSLDVEKMGAFLTAHPSGLHVLAAPVRPDQADIVKPEFAADVLGTLRTAYDYVVIDTPPSFTPAVISAIDSASYVCLVGMLDAVSLKNTRLGLETLALMGYPSERVRIALNRANTSVGITGHDVATILGRPPDVLIPSSRDLTRSVNEGQPIVMSHKRSDTARSFNALGELLAPPSKASPATRRKRMSLRRSQD
jgi:pilus assembly protein CpaE